jgi:hypothetical protein
VGFNAEFRVGGRDDEADHLPARVEQVHDAFGVVDEDRWREVVVRLQGPDDVETGVDACTAVETVVGDAVDGGDTRLGETAVDLIVEELEADELEVLVDACFERADLRASELVDQVQVPLELFDLCGEAALLVAEFLDARVSLLDLVESRQLRLGPGDLGVDLLDALVGLNRSVARACAELVDLRLQRLDARGELLVLGILAGIRNGSGKLVGACEQALRLLAERLGYLLGRL